MRCQESFDKIKKEIISDRVLMHFDPNKPVVLATDASPTGLGAILSHRMPDGSDRPIAFASRSLTSSEKKYSQIDKEATSIFWGLKSFSISRNQMNTITIDREKIAEETTKDMDYDTLMKALMTGTSVKRYGYNDNELTVQDGCILKGTRVMIPASLKNTVLNELHKVHHWEKPSGPWQRIHIDFAGPVKGYSLFIIVDAYRKWVEIIPTKVTTSSWCINKLKDLFTTFGVPFTLVSDNGRQFVSNKFESFLKNTGVIHKTSAPYHPATNGQAERFVQTIKKALHAARFGPGTIHEQLRDIKEHLLRTPSVSSGKSPYELMFGREVRTALHVKFRGKVARQTARSHSVVTRKFEIGRKVQFRDYTGRDKWNLAESRKS
ncbi:uncharacterized protein K02A2.6-like [Manduca sexta]|uniref:uncharacterized protein K02A2.6-like n=1 Tax=Manduca sexta TaxID=7130 RepID=UPI00189020FD|nr:uncharacterized protein K02A2.6-like [Manduca sexta]